MKYKFGEHIPFKRAFGFHQAEAYQQAKLRGSLPANFNLEVAANSHFSAADQRQKVRSIAIFSQYEVKPARALLKQTKRSGSSPSISHGESCESGNQNQYYITCECEEFVRQKTDKTYVVDDKLL